MVTFGGVSENGQPRLLGGRVLLRFLDAECRQVAGDHLGLGHLRAPAPLRCCAGLLLEGGGQFWFGKFEVPLEISDESTSLY